MSLRNTANEHVTDFSLLIVCAFSALLFVVVCLFLDVFFVCI